VTWWR